MSPPSPEKPAHRPELDETPPLLGSWRNVYLMVLGAFALFVVLFSVLTWVYS
jgi:hypothetical protein